MRQEAVQLLGRELGPFITNYLESSTGTNVTARNSPCARQTPTLYPLITLSTAIMSAYRGGPQKGVFENGVWHCERNICYQKLERH
jgi:hypothetical protein